MSYKTVESNDNIDNEDIVEKEQIVFGTRFHKIILGMLVASTFLAIGIQIYTAPKTTEIDEKHWDCTATEPVGIEARCTNFTMKKFVRNNP